MLYVKKNTLFYAFCVRGCVTSHVESDPPRALQAQRKKKKKKKKKQGK